MLIKFRLRLSFEKVEKSTLVHCSMHSVLHVWNWCHRVYIVGTLEPPSFMPTSHSDERGIPAHRRKWGENATHKQRGTWYSRLHYSSYICIYCILKTEIHSASYKNKPGWSKSWLLIVCQNQASLSYSKTLSISNEWSIKLVKNTLNVISVSGWMCWSVEVGGWLHIPFNALIEKRVS